MDTHAHPSGLCDASGAHAEDELDPTIVILLGQMDKDVAYAVHRFHIPHVPLRAVTDAIEAVKAAQAMKQAAVILTGPRGTGKSYAVRYVRRRIEAAETQALAMNPEDHPITRVLYLPRLTGTDRARVPALHAAKGDAKHGT